MAERAVPFTVDPDRPEGAFRSRLYTVIWLSDTRAGRAFDAVVVWAILLSVLAASMETVDSVRARYGKTLLTIEWGFTLLFTLEYVLRTIAHRRQLQYATSFFGIIDLLSILPTYLSLFVPGTQALVVLRIFRTLRLFRIFKLVRYMREARVLAMAFRGSLPKITVFLTLVVGIVITVGSLMYLVEGGANGFTSIPKGIYWAASTLTTVGFGDIVAKTPLGQSIATFVMVLGYSIIAVPTGIVGVEIAEASRKIQGENACVGCGLPDHDIDAEFCKRCGVKLP